MNEIQINTISQKITIVEKNNPGKYKLVVQSENNQEFYISVNTEKYFDNESPSYKVVKNGLISVDVDAEPSEVYEFMIMTKLENPVTVRYRVHKLDSMTSEQKADIESQKTREERKVKLTQITNFQNRLTPEHSAVLQTLMVDTMELYKNQQIEEADARVNFLYNLVSADETTISNYFDSYLQSRIPNSSGNDTQSSEQISDKNHNVSHDEKSGASTFFKNNMFLICVVVLLCIFGGIYIYTQFISKGSLSSLTQSSTSFVPSTGFNARVTPNIELGSLMKGMSSSTTRNIFS